MISDSGLATLWVAFSGVEASKNLPLGFRISLGVLQCRAWPPLGNDAAVATTGPAGTGSWPKS